jgi:hypothetical protein
MMIDKEWLVSSRLVGAAFGEKRTQEVSGL